MEMRFTDSRPLEPSDSGQGLRPLGWSELCARLVASHDTRRVLAGTFATAGSALGHKLEPDAPLQQASFHSSAAALLRSVEAQTETSVNLASSANGNGVQGIKTTAPNAAVQRRPDENCHD